MTTQELQGIAHELAFWKGFVQTRRFLEGWVPAIPTPELNPIVADFIREKVPAGASVLDVGSGVVSILHGLRPDLMLQAADPLGDLYALVFDYKRHKLVPPLAVPAESLLDMHCLYDLVHCSNALDHTQDPATAYRAMYACVNPGGYLIIQGFTDEAINENWQGFHQWNLRLTDDGRIDISNAEGGNLVGKVPEYHTTMVLPTGKEWFIYIAKK